MENDPNAIAPAPAATGSGREGEVKIIDISMIGVTPAPVKPVELNGEAAVRRFVGMIVGKDDSPMLWRTIRKGSGEGEVRSYAGTFAEARDSIVADARAGASIYCVVNESSAYDDASVSRVRALFIDIDARKGQRLPEKWHLQPHFVVETSARSYHCYWLVEGLAVGDFERAQRRLAACYDSDSSVCNPARIMRVPGVRRDGRPVPLRDYTGGLPRDRVALSAADVLAGLPELHEAPPREPSAAAGDPISLAEFRRVLSFIDPTMEDEQGAWAGMAKAIRWGQLPVIGLDDQDARDDLLDGWCGGALWRERTGADFDVPTYGSREVLMARTSDRPREEGRVIGLGTFVGRARRAGYAPMLGYEPPEVEAARLARESLERMCAHKPAEPPEDTSMMLRAIDAMCAGDPLSAAELAALDPPRPEHLWRGLLLENHVNLLYADGGTGKTTLAVQIAAAVAADKSLFGRGVKQMPALLVLAEDDYGHALHLLRLACEALGVEHESLPLHLWCRPGLDSTLAAINDSGQWRKGEFYDSLTRRLAEIGPCLLVLDTVSDVAALDENKRLPVNTLCKVVLGGLCREHGATILVNAHPSKASMNDGSHYAGSTAWNNAVRQRLLLETPASSDGKPLSTYARTLRVAKANYAGREAIDLYLLPGGVLSTVQPREDKQHEADERAAVMDAMRTLIRDGVFVVRSHGEGQKPSDVAAMVQDRHGFRLGAKRVLEHLNRLERDGLLAYEASDKRQRGHRAGFRLGPKA